MSVDLSTLVELLQAEVDAPGTDSFPLAVEDDWVNQLRSAFWETVLDGITMGYSETDGFVTPVAPVTDDLSREYQQLVIFYAGIRVIRNKLLSMGTMFRAKAGPVEYETQNSANVMKAVLDELTNKRNIILTRLSDLGSSNAYYVDMVISRDQSMSYGDSWWIRY